MLVNVGLLTVKPLPDTTMYDYHASPDFVYIRELRTTIHEQDDVTWKVTRIEYVVYPASHPIAVSEAKWLASLPMKLQARYWQDFQAWQEMQRLVEDAQVWLAGFRLMDWSKP